jgi:CheY-like chemotaxis protein
MLARWGLQSDEFGLPSRALQQIHARTSSAEAYALVLTDSHMPEMDGFEFASAVHQIDAQLPVIMITSDARPGDGARSTSVGLAGYTVRPVRRGDFLKMVLDALSPASKAPSPDAPASDSPSALQILVVEDSPDNRLLIHAYLKGTPHRLTFADDGQSGVEQFSTSCFDLVLMDVNMPVLDGLSATRAIRKIERGRSAVPVPVIALSANAGESDIARSLEAGCNAHLSKPVSKRRLLATIQEFASRPPAIDAPGIEELELLQELIPQYLSDRKNDLVSIQRLLQERDFDRVRTLGHNMKGTGASYGFSEISLRHCSEMLRNYSFS